MQAKRFALEKWQQRAHVFFVALHLGSLAHRKASHLKLVMTFSISPSRYRTGSTLVIKCHLPSSTTDESMKNEQWGDSETAFTSRATLEERRREISAEVRGCVVVEVLRVVGATG